MRGLVVFRYVVGKSRHRAHTESQREESGESQFLGSLWRATLSREAWMPIWGLSTESMKPWPPPGGGRGYRTKRRRWCGGTGVPGGHDTHRPFTNRKAAPGEGTVIRARVGRPIPFRARSAQGPVHFPPTWRVMMRRCHRQVRNEVEIRLPYRQMKMNKCNNAFESLAMNPTS